MVEYLAYGFFVYAAAVFFPKKMPGRTIDSRLPLVIIICWPLALASMVLTAFGVNLPTMRKRRA
jgi:hypothetical protein